MHTRLPRQSKRSLRETIVDLNLYLDKEIKIFQAKIAECPIDDLGTLVTLDTELYKLEVLKYNLNHRFETGPLATLKIL